MKEVSRQLLSRLYFIYVYPPTNNYNRRHQLSEKQSREQRDEEGRWLAVADERVIGAAEMNWTADRI